MWKSQHLSSAGADRYEFGSSQVLQLGHKEIINTFWDVSLDIRQNS